MGFEDRLIKDNAGSSSSGSSENTEEVNAILDKMGYNIGCRIVDEFFAKAPSQRLCKDFTDTARALGEQAFKIFLGVTAEATKFDEDGKLQFDPERELSGRFCHPTSTLSLKALVIKYLVRCRSRLS